MTVTGRHVGAVIGVLAAAVSLCGCDGERDGRAAPEARVNTAGSASAQRATPARGVSRQRFEQLAQRMGESEVEAILGEPSTSVTKTPSHTVKRWRATVEEDGRPLEVEVRVSFRGGKLVAKKAGPPPATPANAAAPPYDSPGAVFAAFDAALTNEDWATALRCVAPPDQVVAIDELLANMSYVQATQGQGYPPELTEILARHRIPIQARGVGKVDFVPPGVVQRAVRKEALFAELLDLMDETFNNQPRAVATLRELRLRDREATAVVAKASAPHAEWKVRFMRDDVLGWQLRFESKPRFANFLDWRLGWRL
jgi:hypothetical protein